MELALRFYERDFTALLVPPALTYAIQSYSWRAIGGPHQGEVIAVGSEEALWQLVDMLRCPVEIYDERGECVWWGLVYGVEITSGAITFGVSLESMHNSVAVAYSSIEPGINDAGSRATTAYSTDTDSSGLYGTRELLLSLAEATANQATSARDTVLASRKYPIPVIESGESESEPAATLYLRGWWDTLGWQHYIQTGGSVSYTPDSDQARPQKVGQDNETRTDVGFWAPSTSNERVIYAIDAYTSGTGFEGYEAGDSVVISGSASNDGTYVITKGYDADRPSGYVYTAITLGFTDTAAGDKITDSANNLASYFKVGDIIHISGAVAGDNNGYKRVNTVASDGSYMLVDQDVDEEAAGASITIKVGNQVEIDEVASANRLTNETPGATVVMGPQASRLAQSFTVSGGLDYYLHEVRIRARTFGSPADNLRVSLHADSAGSPAGSATESATVAASELDDSFDWITFAFADTSQLTDATHWLVVDRTGALDPTQGYVIEVDEAVGYADGALKAYNPATSAWGTRSPDADMPFSVAGVWETTTLIDDIADTDGEFIAAIDLDDASGVYVPVARDGDATALSELEDLLTSGTTNGLRLLATVTRHRRLRVYEEPASGSSDYYLLSDGTLTDAYGAPIEPHLCPVAVWARLKDVILAAAVLTKLADATKLFVEESEYDARGGRLILRAKDTPSPWDLVRLEP